MGDTRSKLLKLEDDFWKSFLAWSPLNATLIGYSEYNGLLPDLSSEFREKWISKLNSIKKGLKALPEKELSKDDLLTKKFLEHEIERKLGNEEFKFYQSAVDHLFGPQIWLWTLTTIHPLKTQKDFNDFLKRLNSFPKFVDEYISNLSEGLVEKRISPRISAERVADQIKNIIKTPISKAPLITDVEKATKDWPSEKRKKILADVNNALSKSVIPAYSRLLDFFEKKYLKEAKHNHGIWSFPDGKEAYDYCIFNYVDFNLDPEEIHQIGLKELEKIHEEMNLIAKKHKHKNFTSFFKAFNEDKGNFPKSREELLKIYKDSFIKLQKELPKFFGTLPKAKCEIKPVEEFMEKDSPGAFYYPPASDGSRPGIFFVNTFEPNKRPKSEIMTVTAHEAVPGHHLQITIAQEVKGLSDFRKHVLTNSYVEGWGLYAERLADEMGVYDDYSKFGMLMAQAFRACRLVIDTGLHYKRWKREEAIKFMRDNALWEKKAAEAEIDRYLIIPGQALSYMIGMLKIKELRQRAENELGKKFDKRLFHDEVLRHGPLILNLLGETIDGWIVKSSKQP